MTTITTSLSSNNNNNIKLCSTCNEQKPVNKFYKNCTTKDGLRSQCINCFSNNRTIRRRADPYKYSTYEPVNPVYCDICDTNLKPKNFQKHLIGVRHKAKTKQLEKNNILEQQKKIL